MYRVRVFYDTLDPNTIFGMVGRCGGGYNTVWQDWSAEGRAAREKIVQEYEEGLNRICGHYAKLEESILKEGFKTPLIITCGIPVKRKIAHLPPEIRKLQPPNMLLLEGVTGGSRLWVAQKHKIPVPCIINDFTWKFQGNMQLRTELEIQSFFKDSTSLVKFDVFKGAVEMYDGSKVSYHLGPEWKEDIIIKQRAPLWVSIMNKYGYYVDRLQPNVLEMLNQAGVVQPENLRKTINGRIGA